MHAESDAPAHESMEGPASPSSPSINSDINDTTTTDSEYECWGVGGQTHASAREQQPATKVPPLRDNEQPMLLHRALTKMSVVQATPASKRASMAHYRANTMVDIMPDSGEAKHFYTWGLGGGGGGDESMQLAGFL